MVSLTQFAKICNVHPRTVLMWIRDGRIKAEEGNLISVDNAYVFLNRHGLTKEATILNILCG